MPEDFLVFSALDRDLVMESEPKRDATPPSRGLPPVTPPSGRFIAQLFLVPGMIVLVAVLIIAGMNYMFVGGYTPAYFYGKLDSDNREIRWRGASDLAQVLERKDSAALRYDVDFALNLTKRLKAAWDELLTQETGIAATLKGKSDKEAKRAWPKLSAQRNLVDFLASTVSHFNVPVALPVLAEIAERSNGPDVRSTVDHRRMAVFSIARLGEKTRAFAKAPEDQRIRILGELQSAAASDDPDRRLYARTALAYLDPNGKQLDSDMVRVDRTLAETAKAQDKFLRSQTAQAANFWDGELIEPTLLRLTQDDGRDIALKLEDSEEEKAP
ncbi:MAG: hypothetical protein K2X38_08660 [Gemmataceae bacterium]|nr:hypothetical protein [Gemmataceae bacterium]